LPGHHDVAVVKRTGEQSESRSQNPFPVSERVRHSRSWLHISVVVGVHLSIEPDIARRREKIQIITKTERDRQLR
jgi:hypothetical protein